MKVTTAPPEKTFNPYSVTISVETREDHDVLSYVSMCTLALPDALRKKARASSFHQHKNRCDEYASTFKTLLSDIRTITRDKK